ncbi:hypothetical protein [Peribacillus simplex]
MGTSQADEDYGRLVKEGIDKKMKELKKENEVPGREEVNRNLVKVH